MSNFPKEWIEAVQMGMVANEDSSGDIEWLDETCHFIEGQCAPNFKLREGPAREILERLDEQGALFNKDMLSFKQIPDIIRKAHLAIKIQLGSEISNQILRNEKITREEVQEEHQNTMQLLDLLEEYMQKQGIDVFDIYEVS